MDDGSKRWLSVLGIILGIVLYRTLIHPTIFYYYASAIAVAVLIIGIILRVILRETPLRGLVLWMGICLLVCSVIGQLF